MRQQELVSELRPVLGHGAAYLLLAETIRGLVLDGRLVVGERIPSERDLASHLEVSRTTVSAAYERLRSDGYLTSRHGAGTTVTLPLDEVERPDEAERQKRVDIDLTIGSLPAMSLLGPLAAEAAERLPRHLSGHGLHPLGLLDLRIAIADRFCQRGLKTDPTQVLVTQGALHSWDLALRALSRPGDPILIEQPTYPAAIDAVRAHHCRSIPVAVDAAGWGTLTHPGRAPALAHIVPDHHNPTGHYASARDRRSLSRSLEQTVVAVDETFTELTFAGPTAPPFATECARRPTLTMGSLNKAIWSGLRVGWIRADRNILQRLVAARTSQDSASPVLDQLLAVGVFGHYSELLSERRGLLRQRCDHLANALAATQPEWTFVVPAGGVALWIDLGERSSARLSGAARQEGVRISPGGRFAVSGTHDRFLRIPFTQPNPVLTDAVARLSRAARRSTKAVTAAPTMTWTA